LTCGVAHLDASDELDQWLHGRRGLVRDAAVDKVRRYARFRVEHQARDGLGAWVLAHHSEHLGIEIDACSPRESERESTRV